jgi:hypothetical protein
MRNASVNSGISTVAYGSLQSRRAVLAHAVSPALVFPPRAPPFRGAPFQSGNPPGGKTHPGDTARLSSCYSDAALTQQTQFRIPDNNRGPEPSLLLGWPPPHRRLANPPSPHERQTHRPALQASLLCVCRSALGESGRSVNRLILHTVAALRGIATAILPFPPARDRAVMRPHTFRAHNVPNSYRPR